MFLELNDVLVEQAEKTVAMIAQQGQVTCLTGGQDSVRTNLLLAMMGLMPVKSGWVNMDGEPLESRHADAFRQQMAYAPAALTEAGCITRYEAPSVQQLFELKANRDLPISNGLLAEEMRRTGASEMKARLLAVAVLRQKPVLLVDQPDEASADYLRQWARAGHVVVVSSHHYGIVSAADHVVEI